MKPLSGPAVTEQHEVSSPSKDFLLDLGLETRPLQNLDVLLTQPLLGRLGCASVHCLVEDPRLIFNVLKEGGCCPKSDDTWPHSSSF